jgi:molecular chaperone GrpE
VTERPPRPDGPPPGGAEPTTADEASVTDAEPIPPPTGGGEGADAATANEPAPADEMADDAAETTDEAADEAADDEVETVADDVEAVVDDVVDDVVEATDELQAAADALEVDLELLLSERAQYLDAYRRAQADFENYRKQAQKRQDDAVLRSLGGFVEKLLPVLDACDAALAHGATEVEPVLAALYGALGKEGLERIDPKGEAFDPAEAEAVIHEPGDDGEQVVSEVLRTGYRWRGRVLRPAMVKVTG